MYRRILFAHLIFFDNIKIEVKRMSECFNFNKIDITEPELVLKKSGEKILPVEN